MTEKTPAQLKLQLQEDIIVISRMAYCYCTLLESTDHEIPLYAQDWWERIKEHKNRILLEEDISNRRKVALEKLSSEDRMILGLPSETSTNEDQQS